MARKFSNSFYEGLSPASPRWCRIAATLRRQNFSVAGSPINLSSALPLDGLALWRGHFFCVPHPGHEIIGLGTTYL